MKFTKNNIPSEKGNVHAGVRLKEGIFKINKRNGSRIISKMQKSKQKLNN
jgi:hypothetical protein